MSRQVELWTVCAPVVGDTVRRALETEDCGWDGMTLGDSQNRVGDVYVEMALAAAATATLRLATWVTNPVTRHPSVTAGAAATLQAEADGRIELGIGRGDSALAYLGLAPASVALLERYLQRLQGYLAGEAVPFSTEDLVDGVRPVGAIELGEIPTASRLEWLSPEAPKVPVFVAASGPRVIEAAARTADAVVFSVGADPDRLRWGLSVARSALASAGRDPDEVTFGAHIPIAVGDDVDVARRLVASKVATHARISVMHGRLPGPSSAELDEDLLNLRRSYDMTRHAYHGSRQTAVLTDRVIETFGVAGPSSHCVERLLEIAALGVTKLLLNNTFPGADPEVELASRHRLETTVLPALR